jgi:drug/metabolite transporter (DMT)-like permease
VSILLLVTLALLWAALYTFIKLGVETIPPVTFIASRSVIAVAVLLVIMRTRGLTMPRDLVNWRNFLIQALINSVVPVTLLAWAQQTVDAGLATILNSTTPIFTFLITWGVTRHEAASAQKLIGVCAGITGVALIVGPHALEGIGRELIAQITIVFGAVCFSVAAIFGRQFAALDPMVPATGALIWGVVLLVPLSLIVDHPWTLHPSATSVVALFALAVFSTALAFVIYFHLIKTVGSVATTSGAFLRVPIGVFLGVVFLGETLSANAWLGLVFVVIGVAAMTLPEWRSSGRR